MLTYSRNLAVMINWEQFPFFPSNFGFSFHYHNIMLFKTSLILWFLNTQWTRWCRNFKSITYFQYVSQRPSWWSKILLLTHKIYQLPWNMALKMNVRPYSRIRTILETVDTFSKVYHHSKPYPLSSIAHQMERLLTNRGYHIEFYQYESQWVMHATVRAMQARVQGMPATTQVM